MNHLLKIGIVKCEWIKKKPLSIRSWYSPNSSVFRVKSQLPPCSDQEKNNILCVTSQSVPTFLWWAVQSKVSQASGPWAHGYHSVCPPGQGGAGQRLRRCREDMEVLTAASSRRLFFHNKSLKKKGDYFLLFCHSRCSLDLRQSLDSY